MKALVWGAVLLGSVAVAPLAQAQDFSRALANAYTVNPDLNAGRASLRATDEGVPAARAGMLPKVSASADYGRTHSEFRTAGRNGQAELLPRGAGVTVTQNLLDGYRSANSVRAAESGVLGARETLRNTEANTLLDAVTAYMNVVRDTAIYNLRKNNVAVLGEQVRQTDARFSVGEVTRTDVAQTQSRYAGAKADMALAQSNLRGSVARFKQIIGLEPKQLSPVQPLTGARLPKSQGEAVNRALQDHPLVAAALHGVDVQALQVKIVTGELLPSLSLSGSLSQRFDTQVGTHKVVSATVAGTLNVPIYDGGSAHARTRAAKETLGERRLQVDSARDRVVANAIAAWALMEATAFQIEGTNAQVKAAEIALNGVREEAKVGQRTTLDVLNAEQELLNARVSQVSAQRDRVVASYALLSATGSLSASRLGLKVAAYRPEIHYEEVKNKWFGLTTPSGE